MTTATSTHQPLVDALWRTDSGILRPVALAVLGSLALWVSAKIQIPFYPVPMTMQTFVVLVIGMAYGWRLGAATVLLYLAEGALGLPVFANTPERGIGLAYMMGPTGGFLIGFVLSAVLVGMLAERGWDRRLPTTLLAMTLGTAVIFACGLLWLGSLIGWDKPVLELGLLPFLPGAAFKIALAAAVLPTVWKFTAGK
ncbi:MAG: biotin transporter BioY [Geminicoccaceae bacterium]